MMNNRNDNRKIVNIYYHLCRQNSICDDIITNDIINKNDLSFFFFFDFYYIFWSHLNRWLTIKDETSINFFLG